MLSRQPWDTTYNDVSSFLNTLKSDSEESVGYQKDAQYGTLLNQATQITDATKRNALYQQTGMVINQQAPLIPIYYQPLIKPLRPYVGGFPLHNPQDYVYGKELYIKAHRCLYRHRSTSDGTIHADLLWLDMVDDIISPAILPL